MVNAILEGSYMGDDAHQPVTLGQACQPVSYTHLDVYKRQVLPGLGTLQPSEIAKFAVVLVFSHVISLNHDQRCV